MLCAIYKSKKKPGSYLYLEKRDDFSSLPEALLEQFGKPEIVMMFNLLGSKRLYSVDNQEILEKIKQQGHKGICTGDGRYFKGTQYHSVHTNTHKEKTSQISPRGV